MKEDWQQHNNNSNKFLLQYAGLAFQLIVSLCIAVYGGMKLDEWLKTKIPILVWVLPLIVIIALLVKIIKDTSKK